MDAEQVVRFVKTPAWFDTPCPLIALEAPLHEEASPSIGARVREQAERVACLRRVLAPLVEAEPGIERNPCEDRRVEDGLVELELDDLAAPDATWPRAHPVTAARSVHLTRRTRQWLRAFRQRRLMVERRLAGVSSRSASARALTKSVGWALRADLAISSTMCH